MLNKGSVVQGPCSTVVNTSLHYEMIASSKSDKRIFFLDSASNYQFNSSSIGTAIAGLMTALEPMPFEYQIVEVEASYYEKDKHDRKEKIKTTLYPVGIITLKEQSVSSIHLGERPISSLSSKAPIVITSESHGCFVEVSSELAPSYEYIFVFLNQVNNMRNNGSILGEEDIQCLAMHVANDLLNASSSAKQPYRK